MGNAKLEVWEVCRSRRFLLASPGVVMALGLNALFLYSQLRLETSSHIKGENPKK